MPVSNVNSDPVLSALETAARAPVLRDYPLNQECSFALGGPANYFCAPLTIETFRLTVQAAHQTGLPCFVLGGGSNVLFRDEGFPGLVIGTKNLRRTILLPKDLIKAEAGLPNTELTALTLNHGLQGFAWASGLPGTVGGGIFMNARCYGHEYAENVLEVKAFTPSGETLTLAGSECQFSYKDSIFQKKGYIITEVTLQFKPGDAAAIRTRTQEILDDRQRKGQLLYPSAGCVFKNDYSAGTPAGLLIEECGLKGTRIGGARVFEQHANFIINTGTATTQDVLELIELVKKTVWEKKGVKLQEEIRIVPELPLNPPL